MMPASPQRVFAVKYDAEVKVNFFRPLNLINLKKQKVETRLKLKSW